VLLDADYAYCDKNCAKNTETNSCCVIICCFEKMGFIVDGEVVVQGMISAFIASANYDPDWTKVIETTAKECAAKGYSMVDVIIEI